jgi:hypothetical protein
VGDFDYAVGGLRPYRNHCRPPAPVFPGPSALLSLLLCLIVTFALLDRIAACRSPANRKPQYTEMRLSRLEGQ